MARKYLNLDLLVDEEVIVECKGYKWNIAGISAAKALNMLNFRDDLVVKAEQGDKKAEFIAECNAIAKILGEDVNGKTITGEGLAEMLTMSQIIELVSFVSENIAPGVEENVVSFPKVTEVIAQVPQEK